MTRRPPRGGRVGWWRRPLRRSHDLARLALLVMLSTCGGRGGEAEPEASPGRALIGAGEDTVSVLLHGRIGAALVLEAVQRVDGPGPALGEVPGGVRALGWDAEGRTLFDVPLPVESLADATGAPEMHFSSVVSFPGPTWRLERVEVRATDGRSLERAASLGAGAFADAAGEEEAVVAERTSEGRVRLRWDAARFPEIMVRELPGRSVLAIGQGGEATVTTGALELEVTLSEGVRSAAVVVPVR